MKSRFYALGWKTLDLIFPPRCAGCDQWGERYCASCQDQTKLISTPLCQICGEPISGGESATCRRCRVSVISYSAIRSWAYFEGPLQKAIHKLKYKKDLGLSEILAQPMIQLLAEQKWKIDLITAIPLDEIKQRERGFNQSLYLARPIAWSIKAMIKPSAIRRIKITRSQVGLSIEERKKNVEGVFRAERELVSGKSILVVDDVVTTGSTINSCAAALLKAGALRIYGLTLARSVRP
jgi:ComF family protein